MTDVQDKSSLIRALYKRVALQMLYTLPVKSDYINVYLGILLDIP